MGNWVNWLLVIVGVLCAAAELALGALTGFDLALVEHRSLQVAPSVRSHNPALIDQRGGFCLRCTALFRRWLKAKLYVKDQPSNGTRSRKNGRSH